MTISMKNQKTFFLLFKAFKNKNKLKLARENWKKMNGNNGRQNKEHTILNIREVESLICKNSKIL